MLRIRLSRTGKKKQPSYRVVVANIESKRDGRVVERIGHVNPLMNPSEFKIEEDRALYWLSVGAQPSDAVRRLLEKQGTFDRLARLRQGEPLDMLISEYTGVPLEQTVIAGDADQEAVSEMAAAVAVSAVEEEE
jgi:small subunit ribosomal protein S16